MKTRSLFSLLLLTLSQAEVKTPPNQVKPSELAHKVKPEHAFGLRFSDDLKQTPDSTKRVDKWFRDAKFGIFIHFGVYSMLEGEYKGKGSGFRYSEWVQHTAKITNEEYREVAKKFNPTEFDAKAWAKDFKDAGAKYVVITSKHHDGFALFDSNVDDFNIADHTPFKRDLVKELCDACHAEGLKFGVYYSHAQDWSDPDAPYLNDRTQLEELNPNLPEGFEQDMDRYLTNKSLPQVEELVKNYPLDLIWFDTPTGMTVERAQQFTDIVRKYRPDCLINSRIIHRGRGVIEQDKVDLYDYVSIGDKEVPTQKLPLYIEAPDSVGSSYGYKTTGKFYYHTPQDMIKRFVNTIAAGGNSLINNGPMGNGELDPEALKIYKIMGAWLKVNGEAIYGSRRNPLAENPSFGDITVSKDGKNLYVFILDWPGSGKISFSGLTSKISGAQILESGDAAEFIQTDGEVQITLPNAKVNEYCTVIKLTLESTVSE